MKELLEYMSAEWAGLGKAPVTFFIGWAIVGALAYAAARWRFNGVIDVLRERLEGRNQLLEEYRERLHLAPARGSEFERMSHSELQNEATQLSAFIRTDLANVRLEEDRKMRQLQEEMSRAPDDETRSALFRRIGDAGMESMTKLLAHYDLNYRTRAILLRDEMLARGAEVQGDGADLLLYQVPTNHFGLHHVADHLEALANQLT